MRKSGGAFIFLLCLLAIFCASGCVQEKSASEPAVKNPAGQKAEFSACASKFGDEKSLCFGAIAVRDKNALLCETGDISASTGCVRYYAFETKDLNACASPGIEFDQSDCYVYYAQKTNDHGVCEKAASTDGLAKVNCYTNLAGILKDTSLCNKLDAAHFGSCISEVASDKGEPNDCKLIGDSNGRGICYWKVATAMHEPKVCDGIDGPEFAQSCRDSFQ